MKNFAALEKKTVVQPVGVGADVHVLLSGCSSFRRRHERFVSRVGGV